MSEVCVFILFQRAVVLYLKFVFLFLFLLQLHFSLKAPPNVSPYYLFNRNTVCFKWCEPMTNTVIYFKSGPCWISCSIYSQHTPVKYKNPFNGWVFGIPDISRCGPRRERSFSLLRDGYTLHFILCNSSRGPHLLQFFFYLIPFLCKTQKNSLFLAAVETKRGGERCLLLERPRLL